MFSNLKFFSMFIFVINFASPALTKEDRQLNNLLDCLKSKGVNSKNVHTRFADQEYTELNLQWNTLNGYLTPLVYLVATCVSDIQNAVICSRLAKIRIVPRSGGHSYVKNSFGDSRSLIVDLASLNDITVDPVRMSCQMGPGVRNGLFTYKLWEKGFIAAQGICPTVGISGLALGGGYGHFSRLFGLVADNVIEMEMVDANGKLLVVNNSTNKELFWALRGGGGGNFGIVSKFKFQIYQAPESIAYGQWDYSFNDFVQFFTALQSLISSGLPNNVGILLEMEQKTIKFRLYAFNGPNHQNLENVSIAAIETFLALFAFPPPIKSFTELMTHSEFILHQSQTYSNTPLNHPSDLGKLTKHNHVGWKKVKGIYVAKILNKKKISMLHDLLRIYLKSAGLAVEFFGGAIDFLSPSSTAFVHRGNHLYHIQLKPFNSQGKRPNTAAHTAMKTFYEDSKAVFNHRESYQNYLDEDIGDYLTRYYGTNLKRLMDIKTMIDPNNVFHHPESIPVN